MTDIRTKKLINAPEDLIAEAIEGMVAAHPDMLTVEGATGRAVVAVDGPREGKVGIVIGGGSGHEPAFAGYVGRGLADAAAVGNVFASPSPEQIMDAARAVGFKTAFVRRPAEWGPAGPPDPEPNPACDIIVDTFPELAAAVGVAV